MTAEAGSEEARSSVKDCLTRGCSLYTVDIALVEGLNAIWKHATLHGDLRAEDARLTAEDLIRVYDGLDILSARELCCDAFDLAVGQIVTLYDALYVAAAKKAGAVLYTADRKLYEASRNILESKFLSS